MILGDTAILDQIARGLITIEPFKKGKIGSNSYDVHLGEYLKVYTCKTLDAAKDNPSKEFKIPESGIVLKPNQLYLGVTQEFSETLKCVPFLDGKSSVGRLGIDIHATAGRGDVGFGGHWTLEISVKVPVRVYAGMPIGQLYYFKVLGKIRNPYNKNPKSKYLNKRSDSPRPQTSSLWKNDFFLERKKKKSR